MLWESVLRVSQLDDVISPAVDYFFKLASYFAVLVIQSEKKAAPAGSTHGSASRSNLTLMRPLRSSSRRIVPIPTSIELLIESKCIEEVLCQLKSVFRRALGQEELS